MKHLAGSETIKWSAGQLRHVLRDPKFPRYMRPVVYFSAFCLLFSFGITLKRYRYNDFTTALLSTRPSHPLPQQQIFYFTTRDHNGFGAQTLHLLDTFAVARLMNPAARVCVTQARYWNYGCAPYRGWSCYFSSAVCDEDDVDDMNSNNDDSAQNGVEKPNAVNYENCQELSRISAANVWSSPCIRISSRASHRRAAIVARRLAHEHPSSDLEFMRSVAKSLWRMNQRTARAVSLRLAGLGLGLGFSDDMVADARTYTNTNVNANANTNYDETEDDRVDAEKEGVKDDEGDATANDDKADKAGNNYVAIHIRRGDKIREVRLVSLRAYADAVSLLARPGEPVFIATDDGSIIPHMRELLRPRHHVVTLDSVTRRFGHRQVEHNRAGTRGKYNTVIDLLAEIEVMRRARVFVATFSSNLARLVHVLRKADEHDSISLDDRWAPGVAWLTFGQSYCSWPGANNTFCKMWEAS